MKKSEFKEFVKKNPILIKYIRNGSMSWQKFYEIYDIYGDDESVWKEYLSPSNDSDSSVSLSGFDFIKNLDFDSIQSGVTSLQRVLSLLQDMTNKKSVNSNNSNVYSTRPLYKHFED